MQAVDPVCGMPVGTHRAIRARKEGRDYFFCSTHCRDKFMGQDARNEANACCSAPETPFYRRKLFLVSFLAALLLAASCYIPVLLPFRESFLAYLKAIWWAVLAGLVLGGFIDYYIPREYVSKVLSQKSPLTILYAVFLGFLMSACSHGILALSVQLHKKGASNPAVVSFLLASPWANLTITIMLMSFFGLKALWIILIALLIAINTGIIFMFLEKKGLIELNANIVPVDAGFSIRKDIRARMAAYRLTAQTGIADARGVIQGSLALAEMVLWWIIIGMLLASLAGAYVPTHFFHQYMGPTFLGLLVTLFAAMVIEVCSEGSSPLAFEIYRQTGALGNSATYLMAGVATDYTEIGLLWANVGRRVALWMPIIAVPQILIFGYVANRFL